MKKLIAEGHRLEYEWYGPSPSEAPTLVFLHEGLGCVTTWRDFPRRLSEATGCGAFVYSRLGYGGSDPVDLLRPVNFMHEEALLMLPKVLLAAGVRDAILIGHSDGGSIAIIYAGSRPNVRVRMLILEAPHVFVEDISVESIKRAALHYKMGQLKRALERHHGKNVESAFWGWNRVWLNPAFRSWNIEEYLPYINMPLLVIQGVNDEYGTLRQVRAIESGCAGQVQIIILPDCGHSPHRDQAERTLDAMAKFVKNEL